MTQALVQARASRVETTWAWRWKTPRSRARAPTMKTRKPAPRMSVGSMVAMEGLPDEVGAEWRAQWPLSPRSWFADKARERQPPTR